MHVKHNFPFPSAWIGFLPHWFNFQVVKSSESADEPAISMIMLDRQV